MKIILILLALLLAACAADMIQEKGRSDDGQAVRRLAYQYESSEECSGCHTDQYEQYKKSMHAKAFSNPLFTAQYFNDIVPKALREPQFVQKARKCLLCHAPTVFMNYTGLVTTPEQANRFETGVTCDFCHTLAGYADNGDYLQDPSGKKQGPFPTGASTSHHSEFSGFVQVGVFCVRCHNAGNHIGPDVKTTYVGWRESLYGLRGFTCQECHMNNNGFLRDGKAEFTSGTAAHTNIGYMVKPQQERAKLYNHSFPGAHTESQLQGAINLTYKQRTRVAGARGRFPFVLVVTNERLGHKMPSGRADLCFMWLDVTARDENGKKIPVALRLVSSETPNNYAIAGASSDDAVILQDDVPKGSRLYRYVQVNSEGRQSLFQYDAVKNVFDNRINVAEARKEEYILKLPGHYSGKVTVNARLYYRNAPSSFAKRLQVPDSEPVLVAQQKKTISIAAPYAPQK